MSHRRGPSERVAVVPARVRALAAEQVLLLRVAEALVQARAELLLVAQTSRRVRVQGKGGLGEGEENDVGLFVNLPLTTIETSMNHSLSTNTTQACVMRDAACSLS